MLQIKSVRKTFNETVILQEISLLCERGKIYGIMGRNGSGKSVLFKCICGFLEVDSGEIVLDDQVLSNGKMGNKRVGFIIENPAFLPQYSGFQNLVMLYSINNKTDTQVIKKYMSMVGLDPDDTKKVKKYSMGTFNFVYLPSASISAFSLILKLGESVWLQISWKPLKSFFGTEKAMMEESFLVTKYFSPGTISHFSHSRSSL